MQDRLFLVLYKVKCAAYFRNVALAGVNGQGAALLEWVGDVGGKVL